MKSISLETTLGEIVRAMPARARVFEDLHIDYCCGGKRTLAQACAERVIDPETVLAKLTAVVPEVSASTVRNLETMSFSALCHHVERTYHDSLREELPRLTFLARKVSAAHGDHDPRLQELRRLFEVFGVKMTSHSDEEEERVFPIIRKLETAESAARESIVADLKSAFAKLESEHDGAGAALERFRALTGDYTPPDWACTTLHALYEGLERLERNTHQHVHTENNILFPRALAAA